MPVVEGIAVEGTVAGTAEGTFAEGSKQGVEAEGVAVAAAWPVAVAWPAAVAAGRPAADRPANVGQLRQL